MSSSKTKKSKLRIKTPDAIKRKFAKVKYMKITKNKIFTTIIILILLVITLVIIGSVTAVTIKYKLFQKFWGVITGKKEGWINPPHQESRSYTHGKVQRPNYSVDSHGARCMLSPKDCKVNLIKRATGRFTERELAIEKNKRVKLRDRDWKHRPLWMPTNILTYKKLGISPQIKSDYSSSNIIASNKLDPETHAARLSSMSKRSKNEAYKSIKAGIPMPVANGHPIQKIFKSHFTGAGSMEKYPFKGDY